MHKKHVLGVFLDIERAFDNIPHVAIRIALDNTKAAGTSSNWIMYIWSKTDL